MKRFWCLALLAGCAGREAPSRAPDFEVTRLDGTRVRGPSLWEGRPVLLVFMTSW
jgi:hypothetical protein